MKKLFYLTLGLFFTTAVLINAQTRDNEELIKMYNEDQNARYAEKIDWDVLSKQDSLRRIRVHEMLDSGLVITGQDYYRSALIFQHGLEPKDYKMAVDHMKKAIELDSTVNPWLFAAATDRYLLSIKKPQIYGTQYLRNPTTNKLEIAPMDTTQVTDKERDYYHVYSLKEQKISIIEANMAKISKYYSETGSIKKTKKLISKEHKLGLNANYLVNENELNNFAYQLMHDKKLDDALVIFELNTKLYPKSYNTFDSLGECLLQLNQKEKSIEAYKQSLVLNPKNTNATKVLEQISK